MSDLGEYFKDVKSRLTVLKSDIEKMVFNEDAPDDEKKDMKSLQPVTRLRKDEEEAQFAADNPDTMFIIDTLGDAFKGK